MAKVEHRKARKDYPQNGIAKGEMYYYTKIKTGPRSSRELRSKTPFRRSQLTSSEFLSQVYDIEDRLAVVSDLEDAQDIAADLEALASETREKFEAMPEGLQQGDTGQMIEQRAGACDTAAEAIRDVCGREDDESDNADLIEEIQGISIDY